MIAHTCKALILHCIDFRFGTAIQEYLESRGLTGSCDVISVAGSVKDLVDPKNPLDAAFIMRQIETSKRLHDIGKIILVNHTDCGAYGGSKAFASPEEELDRHTNDLKKAKQNLYSKFPDLDIEVLLAKIYPGGEVDFVNT